MAPNRPSLRPGSRSALRAGDTLAHAPDAACSPASPSARCADLPGLSRRSLLAGMLAGAAAPAFAHAPDRSLVPHARPATLAGRRAALAPAGGSATTGLSLEAVLARAGVSGETSAIALDAQTGAVIEAHAPDLALPPGSTAKAVTAMYVLQALGPETRFVTRAEARGGAITGGVLSGDLVLRGGGDPTLQTADLARLADGLIAQGLRRVEGRFVVDDSALPRLDEIDPGQPVAAGYNPGIAGINLNFNRVYFGWEQRNGRTALSMDARSDREAPPVSVIGIEAASRDLPVYTHRVSRDSERWTVAATALNRSGSRWLPVRRPGIYAGDVLRALLAARGCRLPAPQVAAVPQGQVLAEVRSGTMTDVLRDMLRYSTNVTAECCGLSASLQRGAGSDLLAASASAMNGWIAERYGVEGIALVDHSGLGPASRVSARGMARYLWAARREGILPGLLREHVLQDADGRPQRNHPVTVRAKTGTLNFVSGLAGYAQLSGGREVVFAIHTADLARRRALQGDASERPSGTRAWTGRARALQQVLIERWAGMAG